ncbi:squamosa promoter-binding-like protein 1 isoform X1 [Lactuca sativa]|uniref:squamosa promoter-binding-like protein 1 isoform X1 n=1 Tax=Lactuca sativa TaxID=4236 RepID=UPI000CD9E1AD|nr:squamosa promoter-binding-like protein 1 isoform X1 [Lactuca sativa]
MEARFGEKSHHYYGPVPVVSDLKAVGKRTMEWDLNDWKWDADLFTATPSDYSSRQLFPVTTSELQTNTGASNSSSSCSVEINLQNQKGKRRVLVLDEEEVCGEAGALNLKLGAGGQVYPITEDEAERWEGKTGKKTKVAGTTSNRAVCQVDDCRTDLSNAKDYHRRHKVCDLHSKATKALVLNVMQRFCQQCSRFHVLQEFDEGKRSCRRRLAGHNRRRRKSTHPENTVNGVSLNDEHGSSYLLISLLRILTNIHSNTSDQRSEQDLVTHLLKNLGNINASNLSRLITGSQNFTNASTSIPTLEKASQPLEYETMENGGALQITDPSNNIIPFPPKSSPMEDTVGVGRMKFNTIDLNNAYDDSQDCMETFDTFENTDNVPMWLRGGDPHKSSPPQTSGSTATQSPSSSSGEAQSRTDRIVFKLFGKDPNELPVLLRNQILDWLSQSPSDIEGYIKPGCIILSVYLRMDNSSWDELCYDLSSNLRKLLEASSDSFWRTGWIYTRVLDHVAFACDGQIVLNTSLPHNKNSTILSVKPIAVSFSETAQFSVKGFSFSWSTSRLTCALEGSYLIQTNCSDVIDGGDSSIKQEQDHHLQSLTFSCSIPNIHGRGFIEIEDDSLSSSFFPFIVAEEDVCSEIRTLETDIDDSKLEARNQALEFIHEMGWLLHRSQLKSRLSSSMDPNSDLFSFDRFRWLIEFSVDHDWCRVVNKLLTLIFKGITVINHTSVETALLDIGLLHRAVRRNSRPMVEFLLNFRVPGPVLFKPDAVGPAGLTPLHIAAGKDGSEDVLDALTNDPQMVGVEAWRRSHDSSGLTPYDYASLRGHYPYIHLVQRKMNKNKGHVVVDIPVKTKVKEGAELSLSFKGFEMEKALVFKGRCNECEGKLGYYGGVRSSLAIYKPAMLSMVAIAAVCVCVALLFKSSPQVMFVFQPFIWERLKYGAS